MQAKEQGQAQPRLPEGVPARVPAQAPSLDEGRRRSCCKGLVSYNAETGAFFRADGSRADFPHRPTGYSRVTIGGRRVLAHRAAWFLTHGDWPANEIDHVNSNRADNRLANLRLASRSENAQNARGARSSNMSSGLLGVHWNKAAQKWQAEIVIDGKSKHLGLFECKHKASEVYLSAKRELHPFCTI